jgi:hypothetical protein
VPRTQEVELEYDFAAGYGAACADATARLVLAAARRTRNKIKKQVKRNRPPQGNTRAPQSAGRCDTRPRRNRPNKRHQLEARVPTPY